MSKATLIILIIVLAILIVFSAFFSAAETAYSSVSKAKIESKAKQGKKSAVLIKKHHKNFGSTLATILICNNLVNISASTLIALLFSQIWTSGATATLISTFVMTPVIVIFGEIFPKLLAKKYSFGYLTKIAITMEVFRIIFLPFTFFLSKMVLSSKITNSEQELKTLLSLAKHEGVLDTNEAMIASNALDLDAIVISNVLTPKEKIVSIDIESTVEDVLKLSQQSGHSRILVKEARTYVGIIIIKDIVLMAKNASIRDNIVPILTMSKNTRATKALEEMRLNQSHLILVTQNNESHKVIGICTIEDIIEELVGEIYDEHDDIKSVREIAHHMWRVEGTTKLSTFEKRTKIKLESTDPKMTVKQWVQSRIKRTIRLNLKYTYNDSIVFKVIQNKKGEETVFKIIKK